MNWSWIPQLHYDFIARVIPGCAVIVASLFVAVGPERVLRVLGAGGAKGYFTFGPVVLTILAAYLLGVLLSEVWRRTIGVALEDREREAEAACCRECLEVHSQLSEAGGRPFALRPEDLPRAYVMRTHLRGVVPSDVARLLKLRAERRMGQVLILGFAALAIANLWFLVVSFTSGRLALEIAFAGACILLWLRSGRLLEHFVAGTCIAWLVQLSAGALPFAVATKRDPAE